MCECKSVLYVMIQNYLCGQVRALCSGCQQCPQSLAHLSAGGSSLSVVVVVVIVVVAVRVGEQEGIADGKQEGEGSTHDPPGHGQVVSFK